MNKLTIWSYLDKGEPLQEWLDEVKQVYQKHNQSKEIDIHFCGRKVLSKISEILKGSERGKLPDTVSQIKTWMEPFCDLFLELSDFLKTNSFNSNTIWEDTFFPNLLELLSVKNNKYFIPQNLNMHAFHYNKNIFKQIELKVPTTWNEFVYICSTLKKKGISPIAIDGSFELFCSWYYLRFAERLVGPDVLNEAAKGKLSFFDHKGFLLAAEYVAEFNKNKWFQYNFEKYEYPSCQKLFCEEKTAMIFIGTWFCSEMLAHIPKDMDIGIFALPVLDDSIAPKHEELWANVYAVLNNSENKERAIEFLKILTSREMDFNKSKRKSPTVLKESAFSNEFSNMPGIISNATSISDAYNGLTCSCYKWHDAVFKKLGTRLIHGTVAPKKFIEVLDFETKIFYKNL